MAGATGIGSLRNGISTSGAIGDGLYGEDGAGTGDLTFSRSTSWPASA